MQQLFDFVTNNLPLVIGLLVFVVFTIGFVLALRTQAGRDALAAAAVRLAVFVLGLAEKWLGGMIKPANSGDSVRDYQQPVTTARAELQSWLGRR